ncbi:MAG: aldo/keto reductase [bacterium]|nr:aldo/keto reductase [bacterium]
MNKIILGTAQFGMDYGINNKTGQISKENTFAILNKALESRIDTLDTANSYGESEKKIGDFIKESGKKFKIISKLPKCNLSEVKNIFDTSLEKLDIDMFYGYILHNFEYYKENPGVWNILEELKFRGKVKKIGFSLYFPYELDYILQNKINIDLVQVPYNIFDQRFEQYFSILKDKNVEIHIRSVFLQGLVFKNPETLDKYFEKIKGKIANIHLISEQSNIPLVALCLNFTVLNKFINKVVVGIDSMKNFEEILFSENYIKSVESIINSLFGFKEEDENIILPFNWKLKKD